VSGVLAMKSVPSFEAIRGEIRFGESMARHTSWRVGGPADYWFVPEDKTDLATFLAVLPEDIPLLWTGLGSNLLVRDGGIRGAVVCTHQGLSSIETTTTGGVHVGAGVACAKVARYSGRVGLSGAEFMAGIPGTVGGALAMNAGAYGGETWDIVNRVEVLQRNGRLEIRTRADFRTGYRSVSHGENEWFTAAVFELSPDDPVTVKEMIRAVLADRSRSQPIGNASAGSVFRNPADDHAARLIEAAGLKGRRVGGAMVSSKHANFIINDQAASATDIEQLILLVQAEVLEKFRIELKLEVKIEGVA
jgi:UDP-N-acetylmuramate dehydrogenase